MGQRDAKAQHQPFGIRRSAAYGIGDFGFNLFFTGLNLYLLFYYTDVLGIRPQIAGLIFMVPVIWDAVTDPVMGCIATRTRTKIGRYRPYILFGAPLMALSFVMMFAAPLWFPSAVILSSAFAHIVFRTFYTVVNVPYSALSAAISRDGRVRSKLAAARMVAGVVAGLLAAALTFRLAAWFGDGDLKTGFVRVALGYAGLASAALLIVFFAIREPAAAPSARGSLSFTDTWRFLARNSAFWILSAAIFATAAASSVGTKSMVYYVTYYIGEPEAVSSVLSALLLATTLSIPFWTWLSGIRSKRCVWLAAAAGLVCLQLLQFIIAPRSVELLVALQVAAGLFSGAIPVMLWAMAPDTVEFGEWRSGVRDEALPFGLVQLALKSATGLAVGALGIALGAIGYEANATQAPATLEGIRVLTFLAPLFCTVAGAGCIAFYPIDARLHRRLVRAIEWRSAKGLRVRSE